MPFDEFPDSVTGAALTDEDDEQERDINFSTEWASQEKAGLNEGEFSVESMEAAL